MDPVQPNSSKEQRRHTARRRRWVWPPGWPLRRSRPDRARSTVVDEEHAKAVARRPSGLVPAPSRSRLPHGRVPRTADERRGGALSIHADHEPGLLLALALQVPFGVFAYAIARLLLAAARAVVSKIRRWVPPALRPQRADVEPVTWIAPPHWSCLVVHTVFAARRCCFLPDANVEL